MYLAMVGFVEIIGLISINNGLALGGASRLIPLMVSGPIGWGFTAVAGIAVLLLAILNAATGPSRWDPDSSANNFMESMLLALTLSILGALAFGGGIAILGFMIMIIMLARFIVLEAMIG